MYEMASHNALDDAFMLDNECPAPYELSQYFTHDYGEGFPIREYVKD